MSKSEMAPRWLECRVIDGHRFENGSCVWCDAEDQELIQQTAAKTKMVLASYAKGRNYAKAHVHGRIFGRLHVGLEEAEWRYVWELANETGSTISDVIRWAIEDARKTVEKEVFCDGEQPPWNKNLKLTKRFAHVEIADED